MFTSVVKSHEYPLTCDLKMSFIHSQVSLNSVLNCDIKILQDIKDLYTKISKEEDVELEWKCPGRRPPTPELKEEELSQLKVEESNKEDKKFVFSVHHLRK